MNDGPTSELTQPGILQVFANWVRRRVWLFGVVTIIGTYFIVAYILIPLGWIFYAHRHPALDETPGITVTGDELHGQLADSGTLNAVAATF